MHGKNVQIINSKDFPFGMQRAIQHYKQTYKHSSTSLISSTYCTQEHSGVAPDTGERCLIKPRLFYRDANSRTLKGKTQKFEIIFHILVRVPSICRGKTAPREPGPPQYRGFTFTLRHTTLVRTPLDG